MITDLIEQIPDSVHGIVVGAFLSGLVIWAFGHRLVRPMMVLAGLVAGSALGFLVIGFLPETIPFWIPVAGGALVLGVFAIATYRLAMSWTLAVCLAIACPLGYYTYTEIAGTYAGQPGEEISVDELLGTSTNGGDGDASDAANDENGETSSPLEFSTEDLKKSAEEGIKRVKDILGQPGDDTAGGEDPEEREPAKPIIPESWRKSLRDTLSYLWTTAGDKWQDAPGGQKLGIVASTLAGLIGGFIAGVLMPSVSAAIVTAFSGSLIMLLSGFWLAAKLSLPGVDSVKPQSATASLSWWLGLAMLGLFMQIILRTRHQRRAAVDHHHDHDDDD